jgi:ankyrin repeat protein
VGVGQMSDLENLMDAVKRGSASEAREILTRNPELVNVKDKTGATALHYATFGGHRDLVDVLLESGADINAADSAYGATPAGWAIEYLREHGAFLGIELADMSHAIKSGQVEWVQRFLTRFPRLKDAKDVNGVSFRVMAERTGNVEITKLFGN